MSRLNKKAKSIPSDRNGPKGISDLIVSPLLNIGKLIFTFLRANRPKEKTAPIQKANMTAETPFASPKNKPITKIYFTSPNPSQRPFEIKKRKRNGRATITPEIKWIKRSQKLEARIQLYKREKAKKAIRKESGMMKWRKS